MLEAEERKDLQEIVAHNNYPALKAIPEHTLDPPTSSDIRSYAEWQLREKESNREGT